MKLKTTICKPYDTMKTNPVSLKITNNYESIYDQPLCEISKKYFHKVTSIFTRNTQTTTKCIGVWKNIHL